MVEDDFRHFVPVQHGEYGRLGGNASCETRLAVDHGHLPQGHPWADDGHVLLLTPHSLFEDVHVAFDDEEHVITAVAFPDDDFIGLRAIDAHVAGEDRDVLARKFREEQRFPDETIDLVRDRSAAVNSLQMPQPGTVGVRFAYTLHLVPSSRSSQVRVTARYPTPPLHVSLYSASALALRRRTAPASTSSTVRLSSQARHASVILTP